MAAAVVAGSETSRTLLLRGGVSLVIVIVVGLVVSFLSFSKLGMETDAVAD